MGTTPTYSWPYPEATDPVANGAQDIQDLALAVESTVSGITGGKILQVVTNTYATSTATTSTSYVDSGLDATITPTSATSTIVVQTFGRYSAYRLGVPAGLGLRLLRDATTLDTWPDLTYADIGGIGLLVLQDGHSVVYEDSPATTSAVTYKIQFNSVTSSCTATAQAGNTTSTMMLLEVSA